MVIVHDAVFNIKQEYPDIRTSLRTIMFYKDPLFT